MEHNYSYVGPIGLARDSIDYDDQAKAGIENYGARHAVLNPHVESIWKTVSSSGSDVITTEMTFDLQAHEECGAPAAVWVTLSAPRGARDVNVTVLLVNKTATRLPEALFLTFQPTNVTKGSWTMTKLGSAMDPADVVEGGATHLHALSDEGVRFDIGTNHSLTLSSPDVPLVCFGAPNPFPTPKLTVPVLDQASFLIHSNLWGTNYVGWYPFEPLDANTQLRFSFSVA